MSRAARILLPSLLCACCVACNSPGPSAPATHAEHPASGAPASAVAPDQSAGPVVAELAVPAAGGGTIRVTSLTYDSRVFFDTGRDHPRAEAGPVLAALAARLRAGNHDARQVAVVGHTDDVGSDAYNLVLSRRRAREIVRELVAAGLPPSGLQAIGVGLREPLPGGQDDPDARARNRRVEVLIGPSRRAIDGVLAARHPSPLGLHANHLQVVRVQPRVPDSVSRAPLGAPVSY